MKFFFFKFTVGILFYLLTFTLILPNNLSANTDITKTCNNLITVLDTNTGAYKKCLYQKAGEKFTREELMKCKKYYLQEIERLSYVFKNICK